MVEDPVFWAADRNSVVSGAVLHGAHRRSKYEITSSVSLKHPSLPFSLPLTLLFARPPCLRDEAAPENPSGLA